MFAVQFALNLKYACFLLLSFWMNYKVVILEHKPNGDCFIKNIKGSCLRQQWLCLAEAGLIDDHFLVWVIWEFLWARVCSQLRHKWVVSFKTENSAARVERVWLENFTHSEKSGFYKDKGLFVCFVVEFFWGGGVGAGNCCELDSAGYLQTGGTLRFEEAF